LILTLTFDSTKEEECEGEQNLAPLSIDFKVINNDLAKRWSSQLWDLLKENPFLDKNNCFLGFPFSKRGLLEIANDINLHIDQINKFQWKKHYSIGEVAHGEMSQDELNKIHHHFECLIGQSWNKSEYFEKADQKTRVSILLLNYLIHEFESKKRALEKIEKGSECSVNSFILCSFVNPPKNSLKKSDEKFFNVEKNFGDIFLHYSQLGKNYEAAFTDGDKDIGEENINALRFLTGEFDVFLGSGSTGQDLKEYKNEFNEWLEKNGLNPNDSSLCLGDAVVAKIKPRGNQKSWDSRKFQEEIGKRQNLTKIKLKKYGGLISSFCDFTYSPRIAPKKLEEFFNTGKW